MIALKRSCQDFDISLIGMLLKAFVCFFITSTLSARNSPKMAPISTAQLLGGLAATARAELDMRQRVSASRAGTRRSAQIVVVFSIVVILGLAVFNRSFVASYNSLTGQLVLLVVMALFTMGLLWMRRLAGVSLPRRFLTARAAPSGEGRS